jgi:hypothetical protein
MLIFTFDGSPLAGLSISRETIPIDPEPIEKTITIDDLKVLGVERVYKCPTANETRTIDDFKLEAFILPCTLADGAMTVESLGCAGTLESPLDVFIVPRSNTAIDEGKPHQ